MVSASVEQPLKTVPLPSKIYWRAMAWFGGLLLLCYAPILYRMAVQWATDEDMGHGFFVPISGGVHCMAAARHFAVHSARVQRMGAGPGHIRSLSGTAGEPSG